MALPNKGADIATNTIILIVVTAAALFVLAGVIKIASSRMSVPRHRGKSATIHDRFAEDALRLRRQEAVADELDARAHAAEVEIDIKTARACRLQQQATDSRIEVAAARDHLNDLKQAN
ncbi:hypothetical protein AB4Z42_02705 [Mycobacterium sp. 2YAF39]|uniref:hypothetical protein n=1 Tax=Mycobacterium sp. 2YAF39 TaxID=3233033 RepID=UPI003F9AD2C2